jgi:Xaa-Pro aminopeptidase
MPPKDLERLARIQETLRQKQWDALVLFHPDNIVMATGMLPGSTHVAAVVIADGQVLLITPWWREEFAQEESWADEIWTFDWCRGFKGVEPLGAMVEKLRKSRERYRLETVGYDARMHHYSPAKLPSESFTYDEVKGQLPKLFSSAADATNAVNELKSRKTPREIEKLRLAHQVARAGVEAFYAHAEAGIRETDLAAEVNYAVLKQVGQGGIRYTYCDPPQIASGVARTSMADTMSNHATARRLQTGDLVVLEFGVQADGYWADLTRTLVVGQPTDRQCRMHEAIVAAQQSAIAAYRPGESTGDTLCQAAWETLRNHGFGDGITHFLGHGLGFAYHEAGPVLGPGEGERIQPGNVTSVEPGLYFFENGVAQGGMRVEDNVVWGENAGQVDILSNFERGLSWAVT